MDYPFNRQALFSWQEALVICAIGALLGLLCVWLPWYFLIIGLGAIVYVIVVWLWPEFALLGLLLLFATVFDERSLPSISFGVGHILISDFLLFIPLAIILLRTWVEPGFSFIHTPLDLPLLAFYGVAMFSTISAIVHGTVTFNQSLSDVRVVNLYLTFFIVTNLIRNEKHLRRLLNGVFVLSVFVALMMIVQYFLGDITKILPGRVEAYFTGDTGISGVTRILPPGQSLVLVAFVVFPILLIFDRSPYKFIIRFLLMLVTGLAVIITFNRNFWVAIAVALFFAALLASIPEKIRFVNMAIGVAVIAIIILVPVLSFAGSQTQAFTDAFVSRFSTLLNPNTISEGSLQYRVVETEYALPQIVAHPLIGLGLGAIYRTRDSRIDFGVLASDTFGYIHDGHLWMILKTGLVGYLFFVWFLLLFLIRSLRHWRQITDPFQRAIMLSFACVLNWRITCNYFQPDFLTELLDSIIGNNDRGQ